ncbi:hypothetical protein ACG10_04225 [Azotobacter chroococcum]|nr:hypothetical protein ACG10_04225 [Azotobacter chroococcum]
MIPVLPDFYACYLEIALEIGFADWVREGGNRVVRLGGASDSVLIARSLVELLLQYPPPALPMTVLYPHH